MHGPKARETTYELLAVRLIPPLASTPTIVTHSERDSLALSREYTTNETIESKIHNGEEQQVLRPPPDLQRAQEPPNHHMAPAANVH